jgi:hypothetical protein
MAHIYGPPDTEGRGATVSLNLLDPRGDVIDERIVSRDSSALGISLRTGCFCNPGAGEAAFSIDPSALRGLERTRDGTVDDYLARSGFPPEALCALGGSVVQPGRRRRFPHLRRRRLPRPDSYGRGSQPATALLRFPSRTMLGAVEQARVRRRPARPVPLGARRAHRGKGPPGLLNGKVRP